MKSLFEGFGGTYILGKDGLYYLSLTIDDVENQPIGKWGRMHGVYLEEAPPGLYERLILNGTLNKHLTDANERATVVLDGMIPQMVRQEGITERLKAEQPLAWVGKMNNIRSRSEEIVMKEIINAL